VQVVEPDESGSTETNNDKLPEQQNFRKGGNRCTVGYHMMVIKIYCTVLYVV